MIEITLITSFFLAWASVEDYVFGTVGNYVWILSGSALFGAGFWNMNFMFFLGALWYFMTGLIIAYATELGGADVWALGLMGAGAWILDPVTGLVLVAVSSLGYSFLLDKVLDREIHLIPAFLIAWITLIFLFFL